MPMRKRMLPMASRARSKKRIRPKMKKKMPPEEKATPISGGERGQLGHCWVRFGGEVDVLCESESHIVGIVGERCGVGDGARMAL